MVSDSQLKGRSYLIVEDEFLIAFSLANILEEEGARVYGPVSDVKTAMEIFKEQSFRVDAAILDISLKGDTVYAFAEHLASRDIPFVFVTGYDCASTPDSFRNIPCLSKPCDERELVTLLGQIQSLRGGESAGAMAAP